VETRTGPDGTPVVEVRGEIDISSAEDLRAALLRAATDTHDVVLDFGGVTFIDSSGLRTVIQAHKQIEGRGRALVIERVSPVVEKVLRLSGLDKLFTIGPDGDSTPPAR